MLHHHKGNFSGAAAAAAAAADHRLSLSKWVTPCEKTNGDPDGAARVGWVGWGKGEGGRGSKGQWHIRETSQLPPTTPHHHAQATVGGGGDGGDAEAWNPLQSGAQSQPRRRDVPQRPATRHLPPSFCFQSLAAFCILNTSPPSIRVYTTPTA